MIKIFTILELVVKSEGSGLAGRTSWNDQVFESLANDIEMLKHQLQAMIYEWEGVRVDGFQIVNTTAPL